MEFSHAVSDGKISCFMSLILKSKQQCFEKSERKPKLLPYREQRNLKREHHSWKNPPVTDFLSQKKKKEACDDISVGITSTD